MHTISDEKDLNDSKQNDQVYILPFFYLFCFLLFLLETGLQLQLHIPMRFLFLHLPPIVSHLNLPLDCQAHQGLKSSDQNVLAEKQEKAESEIKRERDHQNDSPLINLLVQEKQYRNLKKDDGDHKML